MMKFLIVGAGSIGTRHGRLLNRLVAPELLVVEPDAGRRAEFLRVAPARAVASLDLALAEHPDAAIICSPTSMHVSHCLQALRADCHVLLEKPVSHCIDGLEALAGEAQARKRVVLVSCNFRFDPALAQMKAWIDSGLIGRVLTCRASYGQELAQGRPKRDYRTVYASNKAMGGGILLDSVHEIDYLTWFFGPIESVSAMTGKLSDLEMDAEDSANLLLRFDSGVRAVLQLDYFRPEYNRSCEVVGTQGIIQWSYSPKMLRYFSRASGLWSTRSMGDGAATDVMYTQQLKHFLDCIVGRAKPAQDIGDAAATLEVAHAALQASDSRMHVPVSSMDWNRSRKVITARPELKGHPVASAKVVTIIQARMGSIRLPGKVLADIAGRPMLSRVIERVKTAKSSGEIVVATTTLPGDDPIVSLCADLGISCYRGCELDVLNRYFDCATRAAADVVVRITADCPLTDPSLVDQMIRTFFETGVDYASNRRYGSENAVCSFPDGLDVEVFSYDALRHAQFEADSTYDREHVTPFIWRHYERFRVLYTQSSREFDQRQWTVDYPDDLEFVRGVYRRLGNAPFGLQAVLDLLEENPTLVAVNAHLVPHGDWRYTSRGAGQPIAEKPTA